MSTEENTTVTDTTAEVAVNTDATNATAETTTSTTTTPSNNNDINDEKDISTNTNNTTMTTTNNDDKKKEDGKEEDVSMEDISKNDDMPMKDASKTEDATPSLPHLQLEIQQKQQQQQQQQQQQKHNSEKEGKMDYEKEAQTLEDRALRFLAKQTHPVVMPSFAAWFNISEIHDIERRSLPDFFDSSSIYKSPKAYKDTRNFMINTYRLSPYEYLTITAVRRNIALDVASIVKIHSFLETWGLINYQIDPRSKPSLIGPSFTGHFQIILDTPQGLKPVVPQTVINDLMDEKEKMKEQERERERENKTTETTTDVTASGQEVADANITEPDLIEEFKHKQLKLRDIPPFPVNLSIRKNIYDSTQDFNVLQTQNKSSRQLQKTYVCHTCGNDTVTVRYHNLRSKDSNLCPRCFQEGHFGANFQASDFIRLSNNYINHKVWSDQELLLLLEGIEMYEDQWDKVVNHVGTNKNLEDCVEKFLTLPIEDSYINEVINTIKQKDNNNTDASSSKNDNGDNSLKRLNTIDQAKAVELTIKNLLDGLHKEILTEAIPKQANELSEKYLKETQGVIQEIVGLMINKLETKMNKLDIVENALEQAKKKYVKETEKLINDRISLSKQINELNSELASLNVSKKLILTSDQVDSGIELVENDKNDEDNEDKDNTDLQKKINKEIEAISMREPQVYKPWSL